MRRLLASPLVFCTALVVLIAPLLSWTAFSHGGSDTTIAMRGYDLNRTGANLQEKILNTSNVNVASFGKTFTRTVDGQVYAQPLYVPEVDMGDNGEHNVVFVATEKNNVYAFDADDPAASTPLWTVNLGAYGISDDKEFGTRYHGGLYTDIQPFVGITSTPAIDLSTQTIYVVTFVKVASNVYKHELHALDMTTGADKAGSPVQIQGSVQGRDRYNNTINVVFNSQKQLQRPGLALANGKLYIAFAGYADTDTYHGWIFSYDSHTLQRLAIYNDTPNGGYPGDPDANGGEGGIWQSGQAPAIDANGNVYVITGNGTSDPVNGNDLGTAFVKLDGTTLTPMTWFMPFDYQILNGQDADIGSSGAVLLPNTNLVIGGGKKGKIYVVDRTNMGGYHAGNDSQIVQSFPATVKHIHGSIVYWNSTNGPHIYVWGEQDRLKSYAFNNATGTFSTTAVVSGSKVLQSGMPGGILAISANGNDVNSGIVWATHPTTGDANPATRPGTLRAYRADTLAPLWDSETNVGRDQVGNFAKFNPPTIADGRVFIGDFAASNAPANSDHLVVYGLLAPSIVNDIEDQSIVIGETATLDMNATGAGPLSYQWYQGDAGDTSNPIAGATARSYTTPPLHTETPYWVRVTNGYGNIDSATARVITTKVASATDLMPAAGSTVFGQSAFFTATVSGPAPDHSTPTGSVTFKEGSLTLGSAVLDASGTASLSTPELAVGSHLVTAFYSGDDTFTISNSSPQSYTVTKAPTTTSLGSTPASAVAGHTVTLQASITADASSGMPSGSVTFSDGTTTLGSAPVQADGTATFSTASLAAGAHTLTARYNGDAQHEESSATLPYTVGDAPTETTTYTVALPLIMR